MGVAEEFSQLAENCKISATQTSTISSRYKRITKQLNLDFWNTDSDTAHSLYIGSYGRDTAAKGISDLDVGFQLPPALYAQYNAHANNGQSALLQAVKKSIQKTYSTSDSFGDGQVVVISFDDNIKFEILPYFVNTSSTWTYPNANDGGSWKACDPKSEIAAIEARHKATNKNLKKVCRMARVWRDCCAVPMSGMLIDTLAYQFIEAYEHRDESYTYYDYFFRDFFAFMAQQSATQTVWRAPGSGSNVRRTGVFEHKARSAELRAKEAIAHDQSDQAWSRAQKWREVFGTSYPA
jgi:hypothetical protein